MKFLYFKNFLKSAIYLKNALSTWFERIFNYNVNLREENECFDKIRVIIGSHR